MKKLFFGLACIIGMMFFASCTQEQIDDIMAQKPGVQFVSETGFTSGNTGIYLGEELNFKVKIAPNSGSMAELDHFDFSITDNTGATVFNENPTITDPSGENIFEFAFTPEYVSIYVVTATVTDKANPNPKSNVVTITVNVTQPIVAEMGTFSGTINIKGHVTTNEVMGQAFDQDEDFNDLPITILLGAIDDDNRVSATIEIDGTPVTLYGTMVENTITFEEFHFTKTLSLAIADVLLDLVMNITADLSDDTLILSGTADGSGKTQVIVVTLEANYNGTIEGTLTKVE